MEILIGLGLVLIITIIAWLINKMLPFGICPICAGVSGTWLLLLVGVLLNYVSMESYGSVITLFMGGTIVGIAYQGEKRFKWAQGNIAKFRVPVMLVGFLLAYCALSSISWITFGVEVAVLGLVTYLYFVMPAIATRRVGDQTKTREIEERLKDCC